jgi:hypothetical protein
MHRRTILRAFGATTVSALGLSRFEGHLASAQQGAEFAALGLPELTITVTETGYQVSPATTSAGWTLLTFENRGPGDNSADVMLLPPGETMESLLAVLSAAMESPTAAPPAWIYQTTFAGAPWTPAGASAQAVVLLSAGDWAIFSPAPLTPAVLTVTEDSVTPVVPSGLQADRIVRMQEYAFLGLEDPSPAGSQVWQVTNTGHQPHFITISELPAGTTQAQFMDSMMAMMSGTPEAGGPESAGPGPGVLAGCSTVSAGQSLYLALDLAAGTYGAICFFPEPETGAPHVMLGMAQVFAVD